MADIELEHAQLDVLLQSVADKIRVAAKRDLAQKVLSAIDRLWIDTRFDSQWRNGFIQCQGEVRREIQCLFTNEGIDLMQQLDGGEGDD